MVRLGGTPSATTRRTIGLFQMFIDGQRVTGSGVKGLYGGTILFRVRSSDRRVGGYITTFLARLEGGLLHFVQTCGIVNGGAFRVLCTFFGGVFVV